MSTGCPACPPERDPAMREICREGLAGRGRPMRPPGWAIVLAASILFSAGSLGVAVATGDRIRDSSPGEAISEAQDILGEGAVGDPQAAWPLGDLILLARWEPGEWRYRITAGPRRGETEREHLTRNEATVRGQTWTRTVGQEYTLDLHRTDDGHLVLRSEIAHAHDALVRFDPPLIYLIAGLEPGERRVFEGTMDVYSSSRPAVKLYRGRVRAVTAYAGAHQLTTPAGTFRAAVIKTEYEIDILGIVSVRDTLYPFYAGGIGKVAEAEHRRVGMGLFKTDTKFGKVLLSFTPEPPVCDVQFPLDGTSIGSCRSGPPPFDLR